MKKENLKLLYKRIDALNAQVKELTNSLHTDSLTKVYSRYYIDQQLKQNVECNFFNAGVLFVDVVDLKKLNDGYGHDIGDEILITVAKRLSKSVREEDIVGRWGGDEFIVIVQNTNNEKLISLAQRIKKLTGTFIVKNKIKRNIIVSIGHSLIGKKDSVKSLIARVSASMYEDKRKDKNL